jgi:23S rRNA pseudoU1915 N3-methylase RlmH
LLGELFRLKLQIVELIIKLSLQKNHLVIEKLKAIKSEHKLLLKAEKAQRDVKLLSIISKVASKDEFADEVKDFQSKFISDEDIDIINYNDWLKKITH